MLRFRTRGEQVLGLTFAPSSSAKASYLISCSPQSTQNLLCCILLVPWACSPHFLIGIFSLTTAPQFGQQRTDAFVVR